MKSKNTAMQDVLIAKLHDYLTENCPDLIVKLQQEGKVTAYLKDKVGTVSDLYEHLINESGPNYIAEEMCMQALTKDLRPSKFNYLLSILEEEFEKEYYQFKEDGTLKYEMINLINACKPVFEAFGFTEENETDWHLRYAITGEIHEYLESK